MTAQSGYVPITQAGKDYVKRVYFSNPNGNNRLQGSKNIPVSNTNIAAGTYIIAKPYYNGKLITTNIELYDAIIYWYTYYCGASQYNLNANVLTAQAEHESAFIIWIYDAPGVGGIASATGIGQFLPAAIWDIMLTNNYSYITPLFTQAEINKLSVGFTHPVSYYQGLSNNNGHNLNAFISDMTNTTALYYNMINNPDLCIKGHCRYMAFFANHCNHIASASIACYFQGVKYAATSYTDVLAKMSPSIRSKVQTYNNQLFTSLKKNFQLPQLQNVTVTDTIGLVMADPGQSKYNT
jgi:hypothetical protein